MSSVLDELTHFQNCELPLIETHDTMILPGVTCPHPILKVTERDALQSSAEAVQPILVAPRLTDGRPSAMACLTSVLPTHSGDASRASALLKGLIRVRLDRVNKSTNSARVSILPDHYQETPTIDRAGRRCELVNLFLERQPQLKRHDVIRSLLECELPLGRLCDLLAFGGLAHFGEYVSVLEEIDVDRRSTLVLNMLKRPNLRLEFPPLFSWN